MKALAFAIYDKYPVSLGHALIVPRREVATWFEASPEEQAALLSLVDEVKQRLDAERRPDGYNIGINVGEAAGQTVMHLHVHLIPRYRGDMGDPRGGVRHVIPEKDNYLRARSAPLATGGGAGKPLLPPEVLALRGPRIGQRLRRLEQHLEIRARDRRGVEPPGRPRSGSARLRVHRAGV